MNCIFCKIINGDIPSYTIYEDDDFKVFLDINPTCNGHTLIIPKKHITDIVDMDNETYSKLLDVTKKIKVLLEEKLNIDGLILTQNNGIVQEVKHYHLHLKPVYKEKQTLKKVEDIYDLFNH